MRIFSTNLALLLALITKIVSQDNHPELRRLRSNSFIRDDESNRKAKDQHAVHSFFNQSSHEMWETDHRKLVTATVSKREAKNLKFINRDRAKLGLPPVFFSADLVKESQRWADYCSEQGKTIPRRPLSQGVTNWLQLADLYSWSDSVKRSGAHTTLMNGNRTLDMLAPYMNRIGIGIRKDKTNEKQFFMVQIYKQVA
jgi:Cysteine-rich secretory protein family